MTIRTRKQNYLPGVGYPSCGCPPECWNLFEKCSCETGSGPTRLVTPTACNHQCERVDVSQGSSSIGARISDVTYACRGNRPLSGCNACGGLPLTHSMILPRSVFFNCYVRSTREYLCNLSPNSTCYIDWAGIFCYNPSEFHFLEGIQQLPINFSYWMAIIHLSISIDLNRMEDDCDCSTGISSCPHWWGLVFFRSRQYLEAFPPRTPNWIRANTSGGGNNCPCFRVTGASFETL